MHYPAYEAGDRVPVRARLAAYLRQEAQWRDGKAVDYPDDPRNARSAETLRALADHGDGLPEDDADFRALEAIQERYALGVFAPGEEAERLISKLGFHAPVEDHEAVLGQLVEAEVGEAVDQQVEEGRR